MKHLNIWRKYTTFLSGVFSFLLSLSLSLSLSLLLFRSSFLLSFVSPHLFFVWLYFGKSSAFLNDTTHYVE